jgi:homoserine dehydrogenase
MKQRITVGLLGLGTVGSGTFRILHDNAQLIRQRCGVPIEVAKIAVRDISRDRGVEILPFLLKRSAPDMRKPIPL